MPTSFGTIDVGLRRLLKFLTDTELKLLGAHVGLDEGIDEQRILDATSGGQAIQSSDNGNPFETTVSYIAGPSSNWR